MAGGSVKYDGIVAARSANVEGMDLGPAGDIDVEGGFVSRVVQDEKVYKEMFIGENRFIVRIVPGDALGYDRVTEAMREGSEERIDEIMT